jgi:hypothetical protein
MHIPHVPLLEGHAGSGTQPIFVKHKWINLDSEGGSGGAQAVCGDNMVGLYGRAGPGRYSQAGRVLIASPLSLVLEGVRRWCCA